MIEVKGKYNTASIYTDMVEDEAIGQILQLCNLEGYKDSKIRIMPDVHAGAGCTIGTTMTITDKITPNLVGFDIGCGMYVKEINEECIDFARLDQVIRETVPSGFSIRQDLHPLLKSSKFDLDRLKIARYVNRERARLSVGTLGGGRHDCHRIG